MKYSSVKKKLEKKMGNYFEYLEFFAIIYDFAILKSLQDTQVYILHWVIVDYAEWMNAELSEKI